METNKLGSSRGVYYPKKCPAKAVKYDSSWEMDYMERLDDDPLVTKWYKNGSGFKRISIPYKYQNEKHEYVPDFFVFKSDGSKEIHEVKAFLRVNGKKEYVDTKAPSKIKAIKEKCLAKGYKFVEVRKF